MRARRHLLEKDLGERTLTHRLAVHLERHFPGWEVDCDYDRLGERTSAAAEGHRSSRPTTHRQIGLSRHRRAPAGRFRKICSRSKSGRRATTSRSSTTSTSCSALTDPHLWFAYRIGVLLTLAKNRRHRVGGLCRRRARHEPVRLPRPAAEGCRAGGELGRFRVALNCAAGKRASRLAPKSAVQDP